MASKIKYFCASCGDSFSKWSGQCPSCGEWNTLTETRGLELVSGKGAKSARAVLSEKPVKIKDVTLDESVRIRTGSGEFDRVLGGGIVKGSLILVGGDPGIGKSTLLLQMCTGLSEKGVSILYVSGEESKEQIAGRSRRLGQNLSEMLLFCETDLDIIKEVILKVKPEVVIIDSIQTMKRESQGSIQQLKDSTETFLRISKENNISFFIIGHVTKEGVVAGPKMLEHMVDTVLYLEGDNFSYRILRAVKNRFGATNEVAVFDMRKEGLFEVKDPSKYLLKDMPNAPGSVIAATMQGSRTILVEVQALTCYTNFNFPKRAVLGADFNRVNIIIAVLEKRLGLKLSNCDVYVNVAGGLKVNEPALDLAIAAAIISSYKNSKNESKIISFGEIGLTGEVRGVSFSKTRIEAKLSDSIMIVPKVNYEKMPSVYPISNVAELMNLI